MISKFLVFTQMFVIMRAYFFKIFRDFVLPIHIDTPAGQAGMIAVTLKNVVSTS